LVEKAVKGRFFRREFIPPGHRVGAIGQPVTCDRRPSLGAATSSCHSITLSSVPEILANRHPLVVFFSPSLAATSASGTHFPDATGTITPPQATFSHHFSPIKCIPCLTLRMHSMYTSNHISENSASVTSTRSLKLRDVKLSICEQ